MDKKPRGNTILKIKLTFQGFMNAHLPSHYAKKNTARINK